MRHLLFTTLALAALASLATSAVAQVAVYDLAWSGASFSNAASASGTITMDASRILANDTTDNSGYFGPATPFVSALSVTVTGAAAGNGTFTLADFDTVIFGQDSAHLNFSKQLIGQPTPGNPWGTPDGMSGDFNLFNLTAPGQVFAPSGYSTFILQADKGTGDKMLLTSFQLVSSGTPEPGSLTILGGLALSGAAFILRRRK